MTLDVDSDITLLVQDWVLAFDQNRVLEARLEPVPTRRERRGEIADVFIVHAENCAELVLAHHLPCAIDTIFAHALPIDALLPIHPDGAEGRHQNPLFLRAGRRPYDDRVDLPTWPASSSHSRWPARRWSVCAPSPRSRSIPTRARSFRRISCSKACATATSYAASCTTGSTLRSSMRPRRCDSSPTARSIRRMSTWNAPRRAGSPFARFRTSLPSPRPIFSGRCCWRSPGGSSRPIGLSGAGFFRAA